MNRARIQNLVISILIVAVSVAAFIMTFDMPFDTYLFPRIVIILFGVLGFFLMGASLRGKYDSPDGTAAVQIRNLKSPAVSLAIILGYVLMLDVIGFYVMTSLFLLVFMKFLGVKTWKSLVFTVAGVDLFIYLLFTYQFDVPLPKGILM